MSKVLFGLNFFCTFANQKDKTMDFTATLKQAGNVLKTSKLWIEILIMTVGMIVTDGADYYLLVSSELI